MARSRKSMSTLVAAVLATLVGLTVWLAGAWAAGPSRTVAWTTAAGQEYGTLEGSGIVVGQRLYSFGGYDVTKIPDYTPTSRSYAYDPASNQWTALRPLPAMNGTGHGGVTHAGIATDGTAVFLAGGYTSDDSGEAQLFGTREVWRYDTASDTYARLPDLPAARAAGGLAYLGGRLHYFGGTDLARKEAPEHWALDLANQAAGWVARAPLPNPRNHLGTAVIAGRIYVVGGQHGQDEAATSQASLESYNPATNTWTGQAPLPVALSHTVATTLDGQLVALGGQTAYNQDTGDAFAYDPATNAWSTLSSLPAVRFAGVAGTIGRTLYYAGGSGWPTLYAGTPGFAGPPTSTTPTTTSTTPTPTPTTPTPGAGTPPVSVPAASIPEAPVTGSATTPPATSSRATTCQTRKAAVTRWQRLLRTRAAQLARDRRSAARHPHVAKVHRRWVRSRAAVSSARSHLASARKLLARCPR